MNNVLSDKIFHQLVTALKRPSKMADTEPFWPYPLPEDEMIARYGLRRLTREEQVLFPGLRLVLDVSKVRLTAPPSVMPNARAGWIVWTAETYPGHFLVRMPGGGTLLAPYNQMAWTAVSEMNGEIPATTLADVKADRWRQQWRTAVRQHIRRNLRI